MKGVHGIPEKFLPYLAQIAEYGTFGMYELNVSKGEMVFYGPALIKTVLGVEEDCYTIDWHSYIYKYCHPDVQQRLLGFADEVFDSPSGASVRYRVSNREGTKWSWVQVFGIAALNDKSIVCGGVFDVTASAKELKRAEILIGDKSRLLEIINKITGDLLSANGNEFDAAVEQSLGTLGVSIGACRVIIWENYQRDGTLFCKQIYEWSKNKREDGISPIEMSYDQLPFLKKMVLKAQDFNKNIKDLPDADRSVLEQQGVMSTLVISVEHEGRIMGFIQFDNCDSEHIYTLEEEQLLKSGGMLIALAILQNRAFKQLWDTNEELIKHKKMLFAITNVARMILENEQGDFEATIQSSLQLLCEKVGANHVSFWRNYYDGERLCSMRFASWVEGQSSPTDQYTGLYIDYESYVPQWDKGAKQRFDIDSPIKELWEPLSSFQILQQSAAILLIPLRVQGEFWGFVGFAHDDIQRRFSMETRDILRSGCTIIASAIARNEIKELLVDAERKATTDTLTGIENRNGFNAKAHELFRYHKLNNASLSVLFLDLDFFKDVNDKFGHQFGDEVLKRFADIIKSVIRPGDLTCRYGGEEFVVFLSFTDENEGVRIGERIMDELSKARFEDKPGFTLTTSIGITAGIPQVDDTLEQYIKRADLTMYKAKEDGRNRIMRYSSLHTNHR